MRVLVDGATPTVLKLATARPDRVGALLTPSGGHRISKYVNAGVSIGIDNGAATAAGFVPSDYLKLLSKIIGVPRILFVASPDVVSVVAGEFIGDPIGTSENFKVWGPLIRSLSLPAAYVGQDGCEAGMVPWDSMDAFFVGGSTRWKRGPAVDLCREAKRRGKYVHCGRVNTQRRIAIAAEMNADSFDGSSFSRWSETLLPKAIKWVDGELSQPLLWSADEQR